MCLLCIPRELLDREKTVAIAVYLRLLALPISCPAASDTVLSAGWSVAGVATHVHRDLTTDAALQWQDHARAWRGVSTVTGAMEETPRSTSLALRE